MDGQMSICQTCEFQDRREDNGQETRCMLPHPTTDYDTCEAFGLLEGRRLGARLAELYNLLDLAWDVIMAILDEVEGRGDVPVDGVDWTGFADLAEVSGPPGGPVGYRLTEKGIKVANGLLHL